MIDKEVKIWAAGFFDGEGSAIVSCTNPGNYRLVICVVNTDRRSIDVFAENWAHLDGNEPLHHGWRKTRLVILPRRKNGREGFQLIFDYIDGERLLRDLYPYLVIKKEEAGIVLRAIIGLKSHPDRTMATILDSFYKEYRVLVDSRA